MNATRGLPEVLSLTINILMESFFLPWENGRMNTQAIGTEMAHMKPLMRYD